MGKFEQGLKDGCSCLERLCQPFSQCHSVLDRSHRTTTHLCLFKASITYVLFARNPSLSALYRTISSAYHGLVVPAQSST